MDAFIIVMIILIFLFVVGIYQKLAVIADAFRRAMGGIESNDFAKLKLTKGGKNKDGKGSKSS